MRLLRARLSAAVLLVVAAACLDLGNAFVAPTPQGSPAMTCVRRPIDVAHSMSVAAAVNEEETTTAEATAGNAKKLAGFLSLNKGNRQKFRQNSFVIFAGLLLAFNSGYINGCCLSGVLKSCGTGVPVSAFTGAYTNAGLAAGAGNFAGVLAQFQMIGSYMTGAALSGLINPKPVPGRLSPRLGPAFLVGSALMALSSVLAQTRPEGRAFLYFAAMANGLQNAVTSAYSANLIRTSHMSGTTSDLGMIFGQMLGGNFENLWRFFVLAMLASSFLTGGITSYFAVTKFKSMALAFNAGLFGLISLATIGFISYQQRLSLWRSASGQWEWKNDAPTARYVASLFKKYDTSRTGYLSEDEFAPLLKEAGIQCAEIGLRAVFRAADTDRDGQISQDELIGMVACEEDGECELVFDDEDDDVCATL